MLASLLRGICPTSTTSSLQSIKSLSPRTFRARTAIAIPDTKKIHPLMFYAGWGCCLVSISTVWVDCLKKNYVIWADSMDGERVHGWCKSVLVYVVVDCLLWLLAGNNVTDQRFFIGEIFACHCEKKVHLFSWIVLTHATSNNIIVATNSCNQQLNISN